MHVRLSQEEMETVFFSAFEKYKHNQTILVMGKLNNNHQVLYCVNPNRTELLDVA